MSSVYDALINVLKKTYNLISLFKIYLGQTKAGYKVINTLHSSQCANIEPLKATVSKIMI